MQALPFVEFLEAVNRHAKEHGLRSGGHQPLLFVPQYELPIEQNYETWIFHTGKVPTRDLAHDRLNAMMWILYPQTKAALNLLQADEIARRGLQASRGSARDAATLWDENLLIVICLDHADHLAELLNTHDWTGLFLTHRDRWTSIWHTRIFGHALAEKLIRPFKSITAHCQILECSSLAPEAIDTGLTMLISDHLSPEDFYPLPVMGLPGWHPENFQPAFYQDRSVFRPPRR
ncbi:MAG: DUF3025 domain-containing protein [Betaproteobacteria bacterium]|nr:DUF3025 domain-containing protein [Betaproteobacteria bacterium]